jgi:ABC-type nitrate/sulfonate/bicarbonate transport system permease component
LYKAALVVPAILSIIVTPCGLFVTEQLQYGVGVGVRVLVGVGVGVLVGVCVGVLVGVGVRVGNGVEDTSGQL